MKRKITTFKERGCEDKALKMKSNILESNSVSAAKSVTINILC
jgi:hypothetical protein